MSSSMMFVVGILGIVAAIILYKFKFNAKEIHDYFKTPTGLGILKGIVLVLILGLAMSVIAKEPEEGKFFSYGDFYAGLDYTNKRSPQCYGGGVDDRTTSNVGFRVNIYESADSKFHLNSKYTHHSCALNIDRESYDAIGVELIYRLW
jgi:hypothetical protein